MTMLDAILGAALLALALAADAQSADGGAEAALDAATDALLEGTGYRWHTAKPGESVQFGVPETDDREFRMDCRNGRLEIMGPAGTDAKEGSTTSALFEDGERRSGIIVELGDGLNFLITVAPDDPILETMLARDRIRIETPETYLSVANRGASALLQPLIEECRRVRSSQR